MATPTRLTGGAPLPRVVDALERAGWGDLAGPDLRGCRVVLSVLSRMLTPTSGAGSATAEQIASRAGYSERWVRDRLGVLEALGIVVWTRGGVVAGRPQRSWFRVNRDALVSLINHARGVRDTALVAIRHRTAERLRGLRMLTIRSRRSTRYARISAGHAHAEGAASLPPPGEASAPSPRAVAPTTAGGECRHGVPSTLRTASGAPGCPICRRAAQGATP